MHLAGSRPRRWTTVVVTALVVALIGVGCVRATEDSGADPNESTGSGAASRPLVGAAVRAGSVDRFEQLESDVGPLEMVRVFARWDTPFPDADHQRLIDRGQPIHLSIRPRLESGESIPWADLARLDDHPDLAADVALWSERIELLPPDSYITFNHEPDTQDSAPNGDAADYVAAWRVIEPQWTGSGAQSVWVLTGGAFSGPNPVADRWYPGDDVVDVVGADLYNWHTCQGSERPWRSLESLTGPPLDWAQQRSKPLAIPETASVEDPTEPGRKAQWIDEAADFLNSEGARNIEFVAWFNVTAPDGAWENCVWDLDTSAAALEAFGRMLDS